MKPAWLVNLQEKAETLEEQVFAVYLATLDPRTPWYAKALALAVAAYALSPIDLIPDFIPVLGYLDDLLILPAGVLLAIRLIPPEVLAECRARAAVMKESGQPRFRWMAPVVVLLWLAALALVIGLVVARIRR